MVTPRLMAYAGADIAKQPIDVPGLEGDFGLTHLEAGARLSFPIARSKPMPYIRAWMGRRSLSTTVDDFDTGASSDLSPSGFAAGAGGGVQIFLSPKVALDGGLSLGVGKMGSVKVDGQHQDWGTRTTPRPHGSSSGRTGTHDEDHGADGAEAASSPSVPSSSPLPERPVHPVGRYRSSTGRTSHVPSNDGQCTRCSSMKSRATFNAASRDGTSTMA